MLLNTLPRAGSLFRQILFPRPFPGIRRYFYRLLAGLLGLPLLLALQGVHWLGFAIDELLFRGYRNIAVRRPVFVLGVPRSGTTRTHHLLADDPAFTTFATWECLFAPSISQRYLVLAIAALDRRMGSPLARALLILERRLFRAMDELHPVSLRAPEEDYFTLMPVLCCFALVIPFPEADWLWRIGRFDREVSAAEQQRILGWYRRCLQRHLYVHGADRILLSKNAAFAGMARALAREFPDAALIICERDALQVVGSQFNSLAPARRLFGLQQDTPRFRDELLACLEFYYRNLDELRDELPTKRYFNLPAPRLAREPGAVLEDIYRHFQLGQPPVQAAHASRHHPLTQPPLYQWGLDEDSTRQRFSAWCQAEGRL